MSKIYDEQGTRMTNEQVAIALKDIMPQDHKKLFATAITAIAGQDGINAANSRRIFAHAVVDTYKLLPIETPEQEKSKKWAKYLLDKYMKSTAAASASEDKAMSDLITTIMGADEG